MTTKIGPVRLFQRSCRGGQVGIAFTLSAEGRGFENLVRSSQRLKNWHLLLSLSAFTI